MFHWTPEEGISRHELFGQALDVWHSLVAGEPDPLANLANTAALIPLILPDLNWAGFYIMRQGELVLGPFWGKPACTRIQVGRGVCGTAVATGQIQRVRDTHEFPGHIACDPESRSEIVVPIEIAGEIRGVLDLDSPLLDRFDQVDQEFLQEWVDLMASTIDWDQL